MEKLFTCAIKLIFCFLCCPFETVAPATGVCVPHTSKTRHWPLWTRLIYLMSLTLVLTSAICDVMQKIKVPKSNVGACARQKLVARSRLSTPCQTYMWYWITFAHLLASVKCVFVIFDHQHTRSCTDPSHTCYMLLFFFLHLTWNIWPRHLLMYICMHNNARSEPSFSKLAPPEGGGIHSGLNPIDVRVGKQRPLHRSEVSFPPDCYNLTSVSNTETSKLMQIFRRLCRITLSPQTSAKPLLLSLIGCQLYSIRNVCVNQNLPFVAACKDSFCLNSDLLLAVFLEGPILVTVSVFLTMCI